VNTNETLKSIELISLENRINEINNNFKINDKINKTELDAEEEDYVRAFCVLSHAEIENFLEDLATKLLNYSNKIWNEQKIVNITTVALCAQYEFIDKHETTETKLGKIFRDFRSEIVNNHGIKEKNIFNMFVPLGIERTLIDSAFLATMDSFGEHRGKMAHTSYRTQQAIDISTEIGTINVVLEGLAEFERVVFETISIS
jgi:hypothetical protein